MLLAIDVGNSRTKTAIFDNNLLVKQAAFPSNDIEALREFQTNQIDANITQSIISSVVPGSTLPIADYIRSDYHIDPIIVSSQISLPVEIAYKNPSLLGSDRIADAVAAWDVFNSTTIAIDFGTATTFNVVQFDSVSPKPIFLGGTICPGFRIFHEYLSTKTAQLPRVDLANKPQVIADNTIEAIQSGIIYGYSGLVEAVIERIKTSLNNPNCHVIATGGNAESSLLSECPSIERVDPYLTLHGLRIISQYNSI